jgi:hypothetical protein
MDVRPVGNTPTSMRIPRRSRRSRLRPIIDRMRHFRLWLLVIGVLSLVAEAIGAIALFWRGGAPGAKPS